MHSLSSASCWHRAFSNVAATFSLVRSGYGSGNFEICSRGIKQTGHGKFDMTPWIRAMTALEKVKLNISQGLRVTMKWIVLTVLRSQLIVLELVWKSGGRFHPSKGPNSPSWSAWQLFQIVSSAIHAKRHSWNSQILFCRYASFLLLPTIDDKLPIRNGSDDRWHMMGSHPTTRPPAMPSPLRILVGRLAMRATTG